MHNFHSVEIQSRYNGAVDVESMGVVWGCIGST